MQNDQFKEFESPVLFSMSLVYDFPVFFFRLASSDLLMGDADFYCEILRIYGVKQVLSMPKTKRLFTGSQKYL